MQRRSRCYHSSLVGCSVGLERVEAGADNDPSSGDSIFRPARARGPVPRAGAIDQTHQRPIARRTTQGFDRDLGTAAHVGRHAEAVQGETRIIARTTSPARGVSVARDSFPRDVKHVPVSAR